MPQQNVLDQAAQAVIAAADAQKLTQHWLIVVEAGVEPELRGPYADDNERLVAAKRISIEEGDENDWPALFRLDVRGVIHSVEIDSFSGREMAVCEEGN